MANTVTQKWFKPVVVVKDVATAAWTDNDTEKTQDVQVSYELLVGLSDAILTSGYNWRENLDNDDVDLAVLNLVDHYMTNADIVQALHAVKIDGTSVDALPPRYQYKALAIRDAVLTLGVGHLFAQYAAPDSK